MKGQWDLDALRSCRADGLLSWETDGPTTWRMAAADEGMARLADIIFFLHAVGCIVGFTLQCLKHVEEIPPGFVALGGDGSDWTGCAW